MVGFAPLAGVPGAVAPLRRPRLVQPGVRELNLRGEIRRHRALEREREPVTHDVARAREKLEPVERESLPSERGARDDAHDQVVQHEACRERADEVSQLRSRLDPPRCLCMPERPAGGEW